MTHIKKPRAALIILGTLLFLAVWQLGAGLYIYAKAQLGQALIAQAWKESLETHQPIKPWSWADTHPVGRLVVKDLGVDHYVLAGASGRILAFGPGHYDGTVHPGERGKAVIAGHRDTHFAFLKDLKAGQIIQFQNPTGGWQQFQVENTVIMNVNEERLVLDSEAPVLALTTCYPFHAVVPGGPWRYVVLARMRM
jgi:sortase A